MNSSNSFTDEQLAALHPATLISIAQFAAKNGSSPVIKIATDVEQLAGIPLTSDQVMGIYHVATEPHEISESIKKQYPFIDLFLPIWQKCSHFAPKVFPDRG